MHVALLIPLVAGAPRVQLVAADAASRAQAEELHGALTAEPQLEVSALLVPRAAPPPPLAQAREAIEEARAAYDALRAEAALGTLSRAQAELAAHIDHAEAAVLLARALRLRGLVLLYLERAHEAQAAFVSASFLEPEFSPAVDEWPPEARLAYADAVAAARGRGAGILSVRVEPPFAVLWLDGRRVGVGPTTLNDLAAGQHALLALAPGHAPLAALVDVAGDGKLDDASLYLEPRAGADEGGEMAAALAAGFGTAAERNLAAALAARRRADAVVLVTTGGAAWLFGADGGRRGDPVPAAAASASEIAMRLHVASEPPAPTQPWYMSKIVWGAAGAAALAGAGLGIWLAVREPPPDRVNLVSGQ